MTRRPSPRPFARRRKAPSSGLKALQAARDAMYRGHIIDAAERVFAERGIERSKMQDIAATAAISLATLYRLFPHKADLHQAIVDMRGGELLRRVSDTLRLLGTKGLSPLCLILQGIAVNLKFFMEHPAFLKMCLQQGSAWYHHASRPSKSQEDQWDQGARLMEAAFAIGTRQGLLVAENPTSQGRTTIAFQQARLANWVLGGMREYHDEVIALTQAEFVRAFCVPSVAQRVLSDDGRRVRLEALTSPETPGSARTRKRGGTR